MQRARPRPGDDGVNDARPATTTARPLRLDLALVLRRSGRALAGDFTAIALAGFALVALPGLAARGLAAGSDGTDWGTLLAILRGVLALLFVAVTSWGVVARARGMALPPRRFLSEGLARATPGLQVALLAAAAVVAGLTLHLFARHGTVEGWLLDVLLLSAALLALCVLLPVVPVAVAERLPPRAAFARAAALTQGNRNRLLALALVTALALAPLLALLAGAAGPPGNALLVAAIEIAVLGIVAVVPAIVYAGLEPPR